MHADVGCEGVRVRLRTHPREVVPRTAAKRLEVTAEARGSAKKRDLEAEAVEDGHRVVRICGGQQPVAGVADRPEVARRDASGRSDQREVVSHRVILSFATRPDPVHVDVEQLARARCARRPGVAP